MGCECVNHIGQGQEYCSACGRSYRTCDDNAANSRSCSCGKTYNSDINYCSQCGRGLITLASIESNKKKSSVDSSLSSSKDSISKAVINAGAFFNRTWPIGIVVALLIACGSIYYSLGPSWGVIIGLIFAVVATMVAHGKGQSPVLWFLICYSTWIFGLVLLWMAPAKSEGTTSFRDSVYTNIEQLKTSFNLHKKALTLFGIMIFAGAYVARPGTYKAMNFEYGWPIYIGYVAFFLITAGPMLKNMIIATIILGVISFVFPIVAPIILIILVVFLLTRIQFAKKHWRLLLTGLVVYGSGFIFVTTYYNTLYVLTYPLGSLLNLGIKNGFLYSYRSTAIDIYIIVRALLISGLAVYALHTLLLYFYARGYDSRSALGIMGVSPLIVVSLMLPFLKIFSDGASFSDPFIKTSVDPIAHPVNAPAVTATPVIEAHPLHAPIGYAATHAAVTQPPPLPHYSDHIMPAKSPMSPPIQHHAIGVQLQQKFVHPLNVSVANASPAMETPAPFGHAGTHATADQHPVSPFHSEPVQPSKLPTHQPIHHHNALDPQFQSKVISPESNVVLNPLHSSHFLNQLGLTEVTVKSVGNHQVVLGNDNMTKAFIIPEPDGSHGFWDASHTLIAKVGQHGEITGKDSTHLGKIVDHGNKTILQDANGKSTFIYDKLTNAVIDAQTQMQVGSWDK